MHLGMSASYFNKTWVDGWNGNTWDAAVSRGTLQPYDRFVSDRTFGEKKRIFAIGSAYDPIPDAYKVIRLPDGKAYMLEAATGDLDGNGTYSQVYVMREAPFRAEILVPANETLPSGMPGNTVMRPEYSTWCDLDKMSSIPAENDAVRREIEQIFLPAGTLIKEDYELLVCGQKYRPREITRHADLTYLRAERITT